MGGKVAQAGRPGSGLTYTTRVLWFNVIMYKSGSRINRQTVTQNRRESRNSKVTWKITGEKIDYSINGVGTIGEPPGCNSVLSPELTPDGSTCTFF